MTFTPGSVENLLLGKTKEGNRVYADVRLELLAHGGVDTNHRQYEARMPEIGISFNVMRGRSNPATAPDDRFLSSGQTSPEDRVIEVRSSKVTAAELELVETAWQDHHLSAMNTACAHMTEEMTARRDGESTHEWQSRMIDTVVCPETGYRWGHAWLYRHIPEDLLTQVSDLISRNQPK